MEAWEYIEGAQRLVSWFGRWPTFHDAEVVHLHLNRTGKSSLLVYAFEMTDELDEGGVYKIVKHVLIEFLLEDIQELELEDFSQQNVLFGLGVHYNENKKEIVLDSTWGVGGTIQAKHISLTFTPINGKPPRL